VLFMDIPKRMLFPLLFLKFAGKIEGKTKFQKMLFLSKVEHGVDHGYEFKKYIYGPYSSPFSSDINTLQSLELINVNEVQFPTPGPFEGRLLSFSLTSKGEKAIEENSHVIDEETRVRIEEVIKKWNSKDLKEIISYVYSKYLP